MTEQVEQIKQIKYWIIRSKTDPRYTIRFADVPEGHVESIRLGLPNADDLYVERLENQYGEPVLTRRWPAWIKR